jgi:hypothetical protein
MVVNNPTIHTFETEEEGWALGMEAAVSCFNIMTSKKVGISEWNEDRNKEILVAISATWMQFLDKICVIIAKMKENGHEKSSLKFQQILNVAVSMDSSDYEARDFIKERYKEINPISA